jgi:hypothetical protein
MQDSGIVLEWVERPAYHVADGKTMKTLMAATLYQLPYPRLVLTRETSMPSATGATVSYMEILGSTLEEWKQNYGRSVVDDLESLCRSPAKEMD